MAHSLPSRRRRAGATPSRLAAALLASGALLGAQAAQAAPVAGGGKPANVLVAFKGRVVDAKGQPLPGVTVLIKGTKTGTSTDANGVFNFNLPTGKETLIFSFVGYKTQEIAVEGRSTVDVSLEEDAASLNDVVVVGYGNQNRATLTGAVATVDLKQIQDLPVGSLSATLQGQLPGVSVAGGTSRPGNAAQITVRNPLTAAKDSPLGTQPLFVIDNVVRTQDDFNLLDQSEVEAISVLKDASAAIYGARGGQGVILVATRRGKIGAPRLSYSGSVGVADATMLPKMMSGVQHAQYLNSYNKVNGLLDSNSAIYTPDELDYFAKNNTNWLKEAWKPSVTTRHALNVSGGSDRVTYFASATYNKQNANFDNINYDRWTFRASTDVKVARGLSAALSVSGGLGNSRMYFLKQGNENAENDMKALLYTPQFAPMYINGLPVSLSSGTGFDAFHFFEVQRSDNFTSSRNAVLNVTASVDYELPFLKGLKARVLFNKNINNSFGKQYGTKYNVYQFEMEGVHKHIYGGKPLPTPVVLTNGDRVRINPTYSDNYQLNGYLTYDKQFGRHHISALTFFEQQETHTDGTAAMREGVIIGGLQSMSNATGTQTADETETESGLLSYAGRINYDYASKYLLEFSIRRDGSTAFAPEYRFGVFPSVSAGWVVSEENFFRNNVQFMDFLKVRGSVGFLGSDGTKPWLWQTNYALQAQKGAVFGGNSDRPLVFTANNALANRAARWDDITKYNAGIDARFLNNRLSFSVDAFYDHRYNMLTALSGSAPLLIGAALPSENYSTVNGFGTEVSVGFNGKITNDLSFNLNTFFSWSDNKQILVDVPRGQIGTFLDPTGQSTDQGVLGYRYLGMFRTPDDVDAFFAANPKLNRKTYLFGQEAKPGMLYYEDIRGLKNADGTYGEPDGKITDADQEYLTPKANNHYNVGFNPSITYKSLSISATMGIAWGGQAMVEGSARSRATTTANRPEFWADHWTDTNPNASMPAPYYTASYDVNSAFWFRSALSAGVRNANISYTIPTALTSRINVSSVRVFLQGTNVFNFFNPYSYKDYAGAYDAYPTLRTVSFGLNVGL